MCTKNEQEWITVFQDWAPDLHGDSWSIEFDDSIVAKKPERGWHKYIRGSFAWFSCSMCKRSWPSKKVLVVFHFRLEEELHKGTVKLRRFRQKCRRCSEAQMEEPGFAEENVEVLVEKLTENIRIKCYNENLGETNRFSRFTGRVNGPHETAHCEACQNGICTQGT